MADLQVAAHKVRQRVLDAISQLAAGNEATAAARQMVRLRAADSQRGGEAAVRRAAAQIQRQIDLAS